MRQLHFLADQEFGYGYFNQPIDVAPLPRDLEVLQLTPDFNQRLDHIEWPQGLKKVVLGYKFTHGRHDDLRRLVWLASLRELTVPISAVTFLLSRGPKTPPIMTVDERPSLELRYHFPRRWKDQPESPQDDGASRGISEQRQIDELRQRGWVPKDCRIHDAISPLQREANLGYLDDERSNTSSDDEARDMREALNYDRGWGY